MAGKAVRGFISEVAGRGDTFLALLKCSMIKNMLSRKHICPESNSPNGQCLLQVICKTFGVVSLFHNVREEGKKWGEEILGENCQEGNLKLHLLLDILCVASII